MIIACKVPALVADVKNSLRRGDCCVVIGLQTTGEVIETFFCMI